MVRNKKADYHLNTCKTDYHWEVKKRQDDSLKSERNHSVEDEYKSFGRYLGGLECSRYFGINKMRVNLQQQDVETNWWQFWDRIKSLSRTQVNFKVFLKQIPAMHLPRVKFKVCRKKFFVGKDANLLKDVNYAHKLRVSVDLWTFMKGHRWGKKV